MQRKSRLFWAIIYEKSIFLLPLSLIYIQL